MKFCKDQQIVSFNNENSNYIDIFTKSIKENIYIILFLWLLYIYYLYLLSPFIYQNIKKFDGEIINKIYSKIKNHEDIRSKDLHYLKIYILDVIEKDFEHFYQHRQEVYKIYKITWDYWLFEIQSRIKVIYKEISRIYLFKKKYYIKWLWNCFAFYTSRYLTSLSIYSAFLIILLIYNSFLFQYIFYYSTGWFFDKDIVWYLYETVNITSNLGWNTEWEWIIQQLFLIYLTVSWVAMFWILIAIINDKIKISS